MSCSCKGSECKHAAFQSGLRKSMKSVKKEAARGQTVKAVGRRGGKSVGKR